MKTGVIIFVFGILALSFAGAFSQADCPGSMIAYWKLDSDAADALNIHDGQIKGNMQWQSFIVANGAKFTQSQSISVPNDQELSLEDGFTIIFWFKDDASAQSASLVKNLNYDIEYAVSGSFPFTVRNIHASVCGVDLSSNDLSGNSAYFAALTGDKNAQQVRLYINAREVDNQDISWCLSETAGELVFGENFVGLIDEIAFYDEPLSGEDIEKLYFVSKQGLDYCTTKEPENSTSIQTDFTIASCKLPNAEAALAAGSCNLDYYCSDELLLYDTMDDSLGCSYGQVQIPYAKPSRGCCPPGYYCNITEESIAAGNAVCVQSLNICSVIDNRQECQENFCYWVEASDDTETHFCSSSLKDLGCDVYTDQQYCHSDKLELALFGYGSENCLSTTGKIDCGNGFLFGGCECQWNSQENRCALSQSIVPSIYNETTNYTLTCTKSFIGTDCVDGSRRISWSALLKDASNPATDINDLDGDTLECIEAAWGCTNGEKTIVCGKETIALPAFSIFSFAAAVIIITLFYVLKKI